MKGKGKKKLTSHAMESTFPSGSVQLERIYNAERKNDPRAARVPAQTFLPRLQPSLSSRGDEAGKWVKRYNLIRGK